MLLMLFSIVSFILFYNFYLKRRKLPPGPTPLPIFGNAFTIARHSPGYAAFQKWTTQFGPVFTYWIGEIPIIAVTSFKLIKETFVKDGDAYAGRDFLNAGFQLLTAFSGSIHGVVRTEGKQWREMRRFTTQTLRNLGMGKSGKTGIETKIVTEVDFLIKTLKKAVQSGVQEHNVMELIDVSVGSIITQIMFGYRFSETSRSQFFDLKRTMAQETQMSSQTLCKMVLMMPWLRNFPPFSIAFENFDQNINKQLGFFDQQISHQIMKRAARATENDDLPPENFVDAFLAKMESIDPNSEDQNKYFSISTLRCLCFELYGAGQETTSSTLNFLVLYLMIYPRVQRKLQEELDRVISSARTILSEL